MRLALATLLAVLTLTIPTAAFGGVEAADEAGGDGLSVSNDRSAVRTRIGGRFTFTSTVTNDGSQARSGLVAHLNVLSTDPDVYVDPEDWSTHRTVYLDPLAAHGSVRLPWKVQAVNDGHFVLYVAITTRSGAAPVVASDGVRLTSTAQRTVNAGGVLPIALGVPGVVLLLLMATLVRRHRLRR